MIISATFAVFAEAAWYWPFGGNDDEDAPPRLSELMEKASLLIDEATDLAADGKISGSVEKYREALEELNRVENENPERAATPEFASLRNKRAYVNAAIDSMLLTQAHENAKAVAVTDTTELEKRYEALMAERRRKASSAAINGHDPEAEKPESDAEKLQEKASGRPKMESQLNRYLKEERKRAKATAKAAAKVKAQREAMERLTEMLVKEPKNRKIRVALAREQFKRSEFGLAKDTLKRLLEENPSDAAALNLTAMCEAANGDTQSAERTLARAIQNNPRDYEAYYNMAVLKLQSGGSSDAARRYYETGRAVGGPEDVDLEKQFE